MNCRQIFLDKTPIIYLITRGDATAENFSQKNREILDLVKIAVESKISFIQIREKNLPARFVFELAAEAVKISRFTKTKILVNDRADIALAAGADGVHLTSRSLDPLVVRNIAPRGFLVGVSTHSVDEARAASAGDADFAVFGPVFDTPSKEAYGAPLGLGALREATQAVAPFPLLALGGITRARIAQVVEAGASGVAAIRLFGDESELDAVVNEVRQSRVE